VAGRLGVLFRPEWPPEDLPAFARDAESEGFAELWLVEDCFVTGGLTMAATAVACTDAIDVGIGLLPVALRNPALTAMEIAGLARIHPARLTVALGHGVEPWMRQIDARPPDRMAALEETVNTVRALLAGEVVTMQGRHVSIEAVRLVHAPVTPPPVLIGTTGPRGLQLAARTADGILLPEGSVPEAVRWARGEAGGKTTVVYAWLSIDDDRSAAAAALRPAVQAWQELGLYGELTERASLGDPSVPPEDDRIRALAVAGDARDCARAIAELWAAGADTVVVVPRREDRDDQLSRFNAEVRPLL